MAVELGAEGARVSRRSASTSPDITPAAPHIGGSDLPLAAVEVSKRIHIPISVINNIGFGPDGGSAPPHLLRLLVSTVLATDQRSPICIVLPSVERAASVISILAALECLSFDLPQNREAFLSGLRPGERVRLYPTLPAIRIGRLPVDAKFRGQGFGRLLLWDAAARALRAEQADFTLLVDAKDDAAVAFYRHYGFVASTTAPRVLFLPLATAAKILDASRS